MFDGVDPRIFWPLFVLAWFAVSWVALWLVTKLVDGSNPRRDRWVGGDDVAEMHRRHARNGFKSKAGIR